MKPLVALTIALLAYGTEVSSQMKGYPLCSHSEDDTAAFRSTNLFSKTAFNTNLTRGGLTIPAQTWNEEYRVLVIYIRFADDVETSATWPDPDVVPEEHFAPLLSEPGDDPQDFPTDPPNITRYFWDNSHGRLRIVGNYYYSTTNHNEAYYHNSALFPSWPYSVGAIIREVLMEADSTIDFTDYDNWTSGANYQHTHSPDNRIDHVWFVLRNYHDYSGQGITNFRTNRANLYIEGGNITLDGVTINGNGSLRDGIILFDWNMHYPITMKDNNGPTFHGFVTHELSHHFFGGGHIGNAQSNGYTSLDGNWEGDWFSGYAANASFSHGSYLGYEKWRNNWLHPNQIRRVELAEDTATILNLRAIDDERDTLNGINLVEIALPNNQSILIESRGYGRFDSDYVLGNGPHARMPKGLFVYNLVSENQATAFSRINTLCADGHYDWRIVVDGQRRMAGANAFDPNYDIIDKGNPNPYNGQGDRYRIRVFDDQGNYVLDPFMVNIRRAYWAAYHPSHTGPSRGPYPSATNFGGFNWDCDDNNGDLFDLFQVGSVISPYTNPPSRVWVQQGWQGFFDTAWVAIHVESFDDVTQSYRISVRRSNFTSLPPAPPQNVRFAHEYGTSDCPKLLWDLNREPDIDSIAPYNGTYEIERSVNDGSWESVTTVEHPTSEYEDAFSYLDDGISTIRYRIRSVDNGSQASAWSQYAEIHVAKGTLDTDNTPHIYPYSDLLIPGNVEATLGITFPEFTRITFCPGTVFAATDSLIFNQVETNEHSWFAVSGTLVLSENSRVDQLKKVTTAASGKIFVGDRSIVLMLPDGQITMTDNSVIDAQPEHASDFRTYSPSLGNGRLWNGFTFMDQVTGTVSNIVVQDAASALATFGNGVSIHDNWLFRNTVGLTAYAGNSDFYDNRVDSNTYAGLVGYFLTNPIYQNRFNKNWIGAEVFMSSNTYKNNRFDSCTVIGFSSTSMNNLNFNENCDTTNGNSMRLSSDGIGVVVMDQSVTNFNCDNSVRLNNVYDFQLEDSDVYGTSEYPASPNVDQDMWSIFSWACSIGYDPVLYKSGSSPGFDNAIATARSHHRNRSGFAALIAYRNAFNLASNTRELRKSMLGILHLLRHARNGNGFSNFNADSLSNVFSTNLTSYMQDTTKAVWFRNTAKEILAFHKVGLSEYADAANLFVELAVSESVPSEKKPGMYRNLVAVRYGGLKNYGSAYTAYLALRNAYPNTPEVTHAKVVLKLPLTDEDLNRVRNENSESVAIPASVRDGAEVWSMSYPNPFNPTAVIRYSLPTRSLVSLRVFSSLGNIVATLTNATRDKGIHEVRFDADDLPSGVYRYELRVTDEETYQTTTNYGNMLLTK